MDKEDLAFAKQKIKDIVLDKTGVRAVELISEVVPQCLHLKTDIDYSALLETMVQDGDIVEVEIVHPLYSHQIKSIYFPSGTGISVRNA